eukprot:9183646-Lingulodinium_polyedra.AAC.1
MEEPVARLHAHHDQPLGAEEGQHRVRAPEGHATLPWATGPVLPRPPGRPQVELRDGRRFLPESSVGFP